MPNIVLNDEMIRGAITGAVQQVHYVSRNVWKVHGGEIRRALTPTDKQTPAAAKYTALANLWKPALTLVYADPAAPKGAIPDPNLGKTTIAKT